MQKLKKGLKATLIFIVVYLIEAFAIATMGGSTELQALASATVAGLCAIAYVRYAHSRWIRSVDKANASFEAKAGDGPGERLQK